MHKYLEGIKEGAVVGGIFLLLTCLLTFPVITRLNTELAGNGSDLYQTASDVLSMKAHFEQLPLKGKAQEFFFKVRFDPTTLSTYAVSLFGFPLGYNLFWLFSFVSSGMGMYALIRILLRGKHVDTFLIKYVALFAGVVYAFTPAHMYWANGFRGATHIEWIPWTVLFLHLLLIRPTLIRLGGLLIFGTLLFQGDQQFAAFFGLFLIPYLGFRWRDIWALVCHPRFRWYLLVMLLGAAAVFWIGFSTYVQIALSKNNFLDPGMDQVVTYSNDLLGILTPTYNQTLWGSAFAGLRSMFTSNRFKSPSYIGITVLLLAGLALRRRRITQARFWLGIGISFFILSLGPILHIAGVVEPHVPLPYYLIYTYVPFFKNIRTVNRLVIIAVFGFSIAASFGLYILLQKKTIQASRQRFLALFFAAVVILEYFAVPYPTQSLKYPAFFDTLRDTPGNFEVLEIPSATSYAASSRSRYYRTIHKKVSVSEYQYARFNPKDLAYQRNLSMPILNELLYQFPRNPDRFGHRLVDLSDPEANTAALNRQDIRYIILYKQEPKHDPEGIAPEAFERMRALLKSHVRVKQVYQDDTLEAYAVLTSVQSELPLLMFGEGWGTAFEKKGVVLQSVESTATFIIDRGTTDEAFRLEFDAETGGKGSELRALDIEVDGVQLNTSIVPKALHPFSISLPVLPEGIHTLTFQTKEITTPAGNKGETSRVDVGNVRIRHVTGEQTSIATYFGADMEGRIAEIPYQGNAGLRPSDEKMLVNPADIFAHAQFDAASFLSRLFFSEILDATTLRKSVDIFSPAQKQREAATLLKQADVQHLAFRTDGLTVEAVEEMKQMLLANLPLQEEMQTPTHILYRVINSEKEQGPFISQEGVWNQLERIGLPQQTRQLRNGSVLRIENPSGQKMQGTLLVTLKAKKASQKRLQISLNGTSVSVLRFTSNAFAEYHIPLELREGISNILLTAIDSASHDALTEIELKKRPVWVADIEFEPAP